MKYWNKVQFQNCYWNMESRIQRDSESISCFMFPTHFPPIRSVKTCEVSLTDGEPDQKFPWRINYSNWFVPLFSVQILGINFDKNCFCIMSLRTVIPQPWGLVVLLTSCSWIKAGAYWRKLSIFKGEFLQHMKFSYTRTAQFECELKLITTHIDNQTCACLCKHLLTKKNLKLNLKTDYFHLFANYWVLHASIRVELFDQHHGIRKFLTKLL